ncbi:MAG: glutaredoxin family protein [Anaerolineales bacterium]|nr:glutaredoxin family protein [Anaerolineales bacterium]
MLNVTLYIRENCHLCDDVKDVLASLQEQTPHRVVEVDVDSDPALQAAYGEQVPVVEVGPYILRAPFNGQELTMTLNAAQDRRQQLTRSGGDGYQKRVQRGQTVTATDKFSYWLSRHYMMLITLFLSLYVGLPVLAPVLMKVAATTPARVIYKMYSPLCHQFGFRSWFLFGEQPAYPLAETGLTGAGTGVLDFASATGITDTHSPSGYGRLEARAYVGDETVGYKTALCERDVAIYGAMLLFALIFSLTGRRIKPLHWALWLLIGLGPIGLDGFSQLFSQFEWPFLANILPYRESLPVLRTLTGFLFGLATAWFGIPYIEESMCATRQLYIKKFAVIGSAKK